MKKTVITIDTTRSAYSIDQLLENYTTMTVGELKEILDQYDNDSPIMLKNDNGYTYGHLYDHFFDTVDIDVTPEVKIGEKYRIQGWMDEVISDYDNENLTDCDASTTYVDAVVTIMDDPDESGWVLALFENLGGCKDVAIFVDLDALVEL